MCDGEFSRIVDPSRVGVVREGDGVVESKFVVNPAEPWAQQSKVKIDGIDELYRWKVNVEEEVRFALKVGRRKFPASRAVQRTAGLLHMLRGRVSGEGKLEELKFGGK